MRSSDCCLCSPPTALNGIPYGRRDEQQRAESAHGSRVLPQRTNSRDAGAAAQETGLGGAHGARDQILTESDFSADTSKETQIQKYACVCMSVSMPEYVEIERARVKREGEVKRERERREKYKYMHKNRKFLCRVFPRALFFSRLSFFLIQGQNWFCVSRSAPAPILLYARKKLACDIYTG